MVRGLDEELLLLALDDDTGRLALSRSKSGPVPVTPSPAPMTGRPERA